MILLELFLTFFKIGLFTFGGGYAMLPLIQAEVASNGWLSQEELVNFIAVSESTPGPFAINIATYIGTETGGILGAACATLGVVMPSFIIILLVAKIYDKFRKNKGVQGCMSGLKPAVVGMIGAAILSMVGTVLFPKGIMATDALQNPSLPISIILASAMTVLAFKKVHPIIIICISAAVGILCGYFLPFLTIA
ncbi:MAG: chromate transporter [Clostridia bacterium]|nr:chromate transporter [Clostridia bacterium]